MIAPVPTPRAKLRSVPLLMASVFTVGLVGQGLAQSAGPPVTGVPSSDQLRSPVVALLEQANFWLTQSNPDAALQSLDRALRIEPNNIDALATAAQVAAELGRPDAPGYLNRLRRVAPNDPRLRQAETATRDTSGTSPELTEARELARTGRPAEAVQRYREIFRSNEPPAARAVEYYQVLAGASEAGYREALSRLEAIAGRSSSDGLAQLAYARLLTYREDTRADGLERLRQLGRRPATAIAARTTWRQALLWLGPAPETADQIETYLQTNPSDPEIQAKLVESRANMIAPGAEARILGWSQLATNRAEAERQFQAALTADPRDAEAMIGLALVRQVQNRLPEGKRLLDQALEISPDRREEFIRMMGTGAGTVTGGPAAGNAFSNASAGWRALNRGDIEGADRFARRAARLRGTERQQGEVLLGQVALRREDYPTAEARFRAALALRPRLPVALAGLYDTFQRQGRFAEAEALQQETGFSPPAGIAAGRAYAMREQAFREENPTRRLALLREALAVDPSNPWLRFDLARLLLAAGQRNEARQIERDLAQDTSAEASAAAALLAAEDDRPGEVMGLLDRVPVRLRTPDMNRLLARSRQEVSVLALERQLRDGSPEARRQLIALAGGRDPSGATAAAVVRAFGRLGDTPAAVAAARAGLAANPPGGAGLRLFVAGSLAQAGQQDEADAMVAPLLNDARLTAEERRQVVAVQASAAAVRSDRLNEAGNRVEAFRGLQPALQRQPESPLLNAALIRLYLANNQAGDAQATAEQLLARDERNRDARDVLIQIAISRRDFRRAEQLMADGKSLHPDDTRLLLLEARLAQARGDAPRAQRLLETGVRRRIAELQATGGSGQAMLTADLISPQRAAGRAGQEPTDTLSAELVRELVQAREATATWLQGGVGTRYHSGTRGLGRLNEITAPLEASTPVPGIGGRLYAQTGTVSLSNGALVGGSDAASQFGTGPLARGAAPGQRGGWITGVTVGVGYANQHVRIDAGSTPLGFQQRNVVGGVEVALPLATNLRLRVVGERRAVNESMLSYAGQRDLVTGRSWGGVTRTGVRAQLEYGVNERLGFYGGGGWATLQGENVRNNTMVELGGGLYYTALNTPTQQLTVGPDLRYFHYDRNLGGFSFGQGGYFSPQSQVIATMNADYRRQWGNLFARVQGSVGYQRFTQHAAAVFPNDSALQTQLEATPFVTAVTPRQTDSGVTGGIRANLEYALSPNLRIGAAGRFNHTGNYSEAGGLLYLRVRLDQPAQDLAPLYANAPIRHPAPSFPIASTLSNGAPEPVQLNQGSSRPIW